MSTPTPVFPNGRPRAAPVPLFLLIATLAVVAAIVILGMLFVAKKAEERRLDAIANAEVKYSATYLGETGDGEGGGMWRLSDGVVIPCHVTGVPADPTLRCGKWGDEPVVIPQRRGIEREGRGQGTP